MPPDATMKREATTHGLRRTKWFGALLTFAVVLGSAVGIYLMSADARREINALATTNSDSTQWALAQSEVELLALLSESRRSQPDLQNIRSRFDVFFSRVSTMQESAVLADLRKNSHVNENLRTVREQLDDLIPIIDGSDANLTASLPELGDRIEELRLDMRTVSLAGVEHFSQISDLQRERVSAALIRLGTLTFLLVAALSAFALALFRSNRSATRSSRERSIVQKRASAIVSTSLDAVIVVDLKGRVIEFNEAAEKVFGYSRQEILGQKMSDKIVPDKYHEAHEVGMNRYIATGEQRVVGKGRVQLEAKHKSGRVFPVELSISSAMGPDGEIFVSFLRDISKRVAKQEELVRARDEAVAGERAKAELVAVMSHEMRTPLNGIVGALELLKTTKLNKTQADMTDVMDTSANMLLQHVNDVLDMSRLEAGGAEKILRPYDPISVAKEQLESLRMSATNRGNTLKLEAIDPNFSLVLGDAAKLRQILTNLVGNAIKFTSHGDITVEIEPHFDEDNWELRVIDQGIGISESDKEKIFDDFVTLDPSYTRAQEGTGLGLAIVRRLVEHLGGDLGVESEKGEGSIFWVKLPTNLSIDSSNGNTSPQPEDKAVAAPNDGESLNVLLVEDNAINRVVATKMLEKLGHNVVEANNGVEGVAISKTRRFDVILMDISMPEMDGVEATKLIRTSGGPNAETKVFAVTAHAMPADIQKFEAAGMSDVLVKPIGLDRLNELLMNTKASATEKENNNSMWDPDLVHDLVETIGSEKYQELLEDLRQEMEHAFDTTFAIQEINEPETQRAEVHRLAGSASILGAKALGQKLAQIEEYLIVGDHTNALQGILSIKDCYLATMSELEA